MSNACFGINDWRNRVFEEALSPKAKLVALALAKYYRQGKECYPSYSVLRDDTGYTNNHTIITAIEELKKAGLIKVKKGGVKCLSMQANSYEFIGVSTGEVTGVSTGEVTGEVTGEIFAPQEDNKGIREKDNKKTSNKKNIINNKKNSKDKTKKFQPPTLEEVRNYAMDRDREDLADKFFEYYNEGGWCDNQGKKLANWKQKFIRWEDWNPVKDDDDSGYVPGQVLALFD